MRAARRENYGSAADIVVEDVPDPVPRDDEVLIQVHASTVSRTDCALLSAKPWFMRFVTGVLRPRLATLGTDFAGVVVAKGPRADGFAVGDRVFGIDDLGAASHAERMVFSTKNAIARIPDGISFVDAAATIEGPWYAFSTLERVGLAREARVLVNGATGAIGSAAVQLCVARDARVTAVGNTKNQTLLRDLGAARVIDYETERFVDDQERYDFVFDAVGKSTFFLARHLLVERGVYVSSELGPYAQSITLALITPFGRGRRVVFAVPVDKHRFFAELVTLLAERKLRAVVDHVTTLDDIARAYAYAASGQKTGAVVVKVAD